MLRGRLLTALVFNVALAIWVFRDARQRAARKPGFAAVLALLWGPLGLGLWESDRPIGPGERRPRSVGRNVARGFLTGWLGLLPATFVLVMQAVQHRSAVPGSLGRQVGIVPASVFVTAMAWGAPAVLALVLGRIGANGAVESGSAIVAGTPVRSWIAATVAGAGALATALAMR